MKIDRDVVVKRFEQYTEAYDANNEKIALKIGHTYRVADLCEQIACAEGMDGADADLAWLLGMLHDIGRFEQLRKYNTFIDAESVSHAALGAEILFGGKQEEKGREGGIIREFVPDSSEDVLLELAVRLHSAYRVPANQDARTVKFCHILRDADKIDIQRVNIETPLEEIYNTTAEELYHAEITKEVADGFYEHHAIRSSLKRTLADHIVGHVSLLYELVYPESIRLVNEQGYWKKLIAFPSQNPRTAKQLKLLSEEMQRYLESKKQG